MSDQNLNPENENLTADDFIPIEYQIDIPNWENVYKNDIEKRLYDLAADHNDITGAAVALTEQAKDATPHMMEARVLIYCRPENIVGREKADTVEGALNGALKAAERQVWEKRKKLGQPWKRADLPGAPGSNTDVKT
jgi:hypothetical protein